VWCLRARGFSRALCFSIGSLPAIASSSARSAKGRGRFRQLRFVAGKARKFAQVGEWLKPTDCKSVPPCEVRRFESFPVHQVCGRGGGSRNPKRREGSSEAFNRRAGRVRCFGNFVLEHDQRPANSPGDASGAGDVRAEDVGTPERCAAPGWWWRYKITAATV
jgi:hypothetical protein